MISDLEILRTRKSVSRCRGRHRESSLRPEHVTARRVRSGGRARWAEGRGNRDQQEGCRTSGLITGSRININFSDASLGPLAVLCNLMDLEGNGYANRGDLFILTTSGAQRFSATTNYSVVVLFEPTAVSYSTPRSTDEWHEARGGGFEPPSSFEHWIFALPRFEKG